MGPLISGKSRLMKYFNVDIWPDWCISPKWDHNFLNHSTYEGSLDDL